MSSLHPLRSLRVKLVLASVLVEIVLLSLLVWNSTRVIEESLFEQARVRVQELNPLLNASLAGALAQRDYGALEEILKESQRAKGVSYLVLYDNYENMVASVGWDPHQPLPPVETDIAGADSGDPSSFDTMTPIILAGQRYGVLRYGISTEFLQNAKSILVRQSLLIAAAEVALSIVLLALLGFWLTRHLAMLSRASEQVAAGNLDIHLPVRTQDEVGQLTRAFNYMSEAVRSRINELSASEARSHAIADYTYGWEHWTAPEGRLIWVNPSVERLTGYAPEECLAMENYPFPLVAEWDRDRIAAEFRQARNRTSTGKDLEFQARRKNGSTFWVSASWQPIFGAHGEFLGQRASLRDISERKQVELALHDKVLALQQSEEKQSQLLHQSRQEQARMSSLLSAMNIGILFEDFENRIIYVNPAFRRIWLIPDSVELAGRPTREVLELSANVLSRPDHFSKHILHVLDTHQVSETFEIVMADGRVVTQLSYPVRDGRASFVGRLWIYEDVTRERQTAEQLIYLAERDSLTGLFNRHHFQEQLGNTLIEVERRHSFGALLFFDLDEFKYINDTFGHRAGDAMLIRVAGEISSLIRRNEVFSRIGGDEFALLMPDATEQEAAQLAERIIRAVSQIPFRFDGQNLRLTTSLGIALYPLHGSDVEELISHADAAMYQAKEAGKNAWRVYRAELDASREMLTRMSWQERIGNAIEKDLLRLHFQGVYKADDGTLAHLEALVRMVDESDPQRVIMPGHFISFAEKTGRILDIDRWVIRECVRLLSTSRYVPALAVNVSGRSLDDPALPQYIGDQLVQFRVEPSRLLLELTETAAVSDLHDAQRFIEALRQTGCRVCLDDFGTGFSSFAYLKHLKADVLKIDGLFIRDLPNDHDNQVFVKSIVDVARGMRKITIAEFVENAETLEMLRGFGVDMVQGYHLDMPRGGHPALNMAGE
jgi:diguanylate cyclase (GGDEF)-like protein/PAS domain S-box-containing protein